MSQIKPIKVAILITGILYPLMVISLIASGEGIAYSLFISVFFTLGLLLLIWIVLGLLSIIVLGLLSIFGLAIEPLLKPLGALLKPLLKWLKD
jgi:hypothetical protein